MKITVYSTTTCPYCVMLKRWLDSKGLIYTDYLVDQNPYAAQMMLTQSDGQTAVPFTTIEHADGTLSKVLGFDRLALETIIDKADAMPAKKEVESDND